MLGGDEDSVDQRSQREVRSSVLARRSRMPASMSSANSGSGRVALEEAKKIAVAANARAVVVDRPKVSEPGHYLRHFRRRQRGQLFNHPFHACRHL